MTPIHRILVASAILAVALSAAACSSSPSPQSSAESANALVTQGLSVESLGHIQTAIQDFSSAVGKKPSDAIAYYDLGVIYQQRLAKPTQAATYYNKAIQADPTYRPALFNLAIIETSSDAQGAIALYNKLLTLNPNDPNTLFNLGLLLISQNQTTQGHADLQKAIFLNPALKARVPAGITP